MLDGVGERLPVDVLPCSNGECYPPPASDRQRAIMALADVETERWRRRFSMSRRDFVRTAAATAIGLWAIDAVGPTRFGHHALGHSGRRCRCLQPRLRRGGRAR